jgi:hypothetical protein
VTVVGLDLRRGQDQDAVAILERMILARRVELAVLGQHDAVERTLLVLALHELQIGLDGGAAVVRELGMEMQVENHPSRER